MLFCCDRCGERKVALTVREYVIARHDHTCQPTLVPVSGYHPRHLREVVGGS